MEHPSFAELAKDDPWMQAHLVDEKNPINFIAVPPTLTRPSAVLTTTIAAIAKKRQVTPRHRASEKATPAKMDNSTKPTLKLPLSALSIRITLSSADRALLLMDTLIKTCSQRGLTISIKNQYVYVGYEGHSVQLQISERVEQIAGSIKGLSKFDVAMKRHITYHTTDELSISVERLGYARKTTDKSGIRLENQLVTVLNHIYRGIAETRAWFSHLAKTMADSKAREDARKAEVATREVAAAEAKRIADDCRQQQLDLVIKATAWQQSKTILAYTDHLVAHATLTGAPISAELRAWIEWATNTAESMDPTSNRVAQTRDAGQVAD